MKESRLCWKLTTLPHTMRVARNKSNIYWLYQGIDRVEWLVIVSESLVIIAWIQYIEQTLMCADYGTCGPTVSMVWRLIRPGFCQIVLINSLYFLKVRSGSTNLVFSFSRSAVNNKHSPSYRLLFVFDDFLMITNKTKRRRNNLLTEGRTTKQRWCNTSICHYVNMLFPINWRQFADSFVAPRYSLFCYWRRRISQSRNPSQMRNRRGRFFESGHSS